MALNDITDLLNNSVKLMSKNIIKYLQKTYGDSHEQIGEEIGVSEDFISRVSRGKASLSFKQVNKLEKSYDIKLVIEMLKDINPKDINPQLRPLYDSFMKRINQ